MLPTLTHGLRLCALSLLAAAGPVWCADPAPVRPPIEAFFDNPAFSDPVLSPNGRYLAVKMGAKGRRDGIAMLKLDDNSGKAVAYFADADIGNFQWINDERLLFDTTDKQLGSGDPEFAPGLYAVNKDGSDLRQLADRSGAMIVNARGLSERKLLPWHTFMLDQYGAQDSEYVYVRSVEFDMGGARVVNLLRLNTLNGKVQVVPRPAQAHAWLLDQAGEPRIAIGGERATDTVYYRDPASKEWRTLLENDAFLSERGNIVPLAFGPDGTLYVASSRGRDTSAVHTLDLATGALSDRPVIVTTGYDFEGGLIVSKGKVQGLRYLTDTTSTLWFDEGMKAVQQKVDQRMPSTVNLISVARRPETPFVLVQSFSDVLPPVFFIYNTESGTLNKLGESYPQIQPAQMGSQEAVHYQARDGMDIPAWLTLPQGSKRTNLPLVVLVHGGPYVRGNAWGWAPESQFLASRGYAVLEPEFRGSTGFGAKLFNGAIKQWGLAMQDDLADGAKWAIAQGIADPKRICIAGASYGGYATLMGLIRDPQLFRCGIDWAGVTDINLLYDGHWSFRSDLPKRWKRYGMPFMIGDQVKDAAQLKAASPLEQAARIRQPLLLAYGAQDRRVPVYHGRKFLEAVKLGNSQVEWVLYEDEGHGWALPKNRIDFWNRVERFLDQHIGKP